MTNCLRNAVLLGIGDGSVVERRTRDRKVSVRVPAGASGMFLLQGQLSVMTLIPPTCPFHPRVTAVARTKNPGHSAENGDGRLQLIMHASYVGGF